MRKYRFLCLILAIFLLSGCTQMRTPAQDETVQTVIAVQPSMVTPTETPAEVADTHEDAAQVPVMPADASHKVPTAPAKDAPTAEADRDTDVITPVATYSLTPYYMNTIYRNAAGNDVLELSIDTPVMDAAHAAGSLFNRYFSDRSLAYAEYVSETIVPTLDTAPEAPAVARMAYNVCYAEGSYLCVAITYQEDLPDAQNARSTAALFDLENAALVDEWDVQNMAELTQESVLARIETI